MLMGGGRLGRGAPCLSARRFLIRKQGISKKMVGDSNAYHIIYINLYTYRNRFTLSKGNRIYLQNPLQKETGKWKGKI